MAVPARKESLVLRLGRQEFEFGSGRFVDVREGPNVRQAFDGASLESLSTGFVASPSRVHEGSGSGESFSFEALLITQSHHGVDEGSPSRRQVACDRCDYQQHNGCAHERDRVGGLESEQHVGD